MPFAGEIKVDESYFGAKIKGVGNRELPAKYLDTKPIDSFVMATATPLTALGGMGRALNGGTGCSCRSLPTEGEA